MTKNEAAGSEIQLSEETHLGYTFFKMSADILASLFIKIYGGLPTGFQRLRDGFSAPVTAIHCGADSFTVQIYEAGRFTGNKHSTFSQKNW